MLFLCRFPDLRAHQHLLVQIRVKAAFTDTLAATNQIDFCFQSEDKFCLIGSDRSRNVGNRWCRGVLPSKICPKCEISQATDKILLNDGGILPSLTASSSAAARLPVVFYRLGDNDPQSNLGGWTPSEAREVSKRSVGLHQ